MKFNRLAISNFGIYKGFHTVEFDTDADSPIVLFGALNGSGKTTLLDALQLVLYGKHAECSNRGRLGYKAFLAQTINHHADLKKGASISLEFSSFHFGQEDRFMVRRAWNMTGKNNLQETVEVFKNGQPDKPMTEQWEEYIEVLLPSRIASLFFFDGEKVGGVVESGSTASLIKKGVFALLGLDQIERLKSDLVAVERRRKLAASSSETQKKIQLLETDKSKLCEKISRLHQKLAELQNESDQCQKQLLKLSKKFKLEGGELFEQQSSYEKELSEIRNNKTRIEAQLRELAAGQLPLLIISELLKQTEIQCQAEKKAMIDEQMHQELVIRDKKIRQLLESCTNNKDIINTFESFISEDYDERKRSAATECYLNRNPDIFAYVQPEHLQHRKKEAEKLIAALDQLESKEEEQLRILAAIPSKESVTPILDSIREARSKLEKINLQSNHVEEEYNTAKTQLQRLEDDLSRLYELGSDESFASTLTEAAIKRSEKARIILEKFRHRIILKHIHTLESCIFESFRYLLRKEDLVHQVRIDPDSYELSLYGKEHNIIPTSRLSAGERQLLAISILWGLAKASGKPLPVIIDTPLGRLDGKHRSHLLDRYFPAASHQVILLSTDKEIDQEYYQTLRPAIGREYLINYVESENTSKITSGYFWEAAQ